MQITSIACMEEKIHELRLAAHATALRGCSMFADVPADDLKKIARIALPRRTERGEYFSVKAIRRVVFSSSEKVQ